MMSMDISLLKGNTMQTQLNDNSPNIIETMFHQFNEHDFYGLEFIMDELNEQKELCKANVSTNTDWFGLADTCVFLDC